jgi:hypothetical protein
LTHDQLGVLWYLCLGHLHSRHVSTLHHYTQGVPQVPIALPTNLTTSLFNPSAGRQPNLHPLIAFGCHVIAHHLLDLGSVLLHTFSCAGSRMICAPFVMINDCTTVMCHDF